jgi:hypothetical protein
MKKHAARHGKTVAWQGTVAIVSDRLSNDDPAWETIRGLHGEERWVGLTSLRKTGWIIRIIAQSGLVLRDTLGEIRRHLAESFPALKSNVRKL